MKRERERKPSLPEKFKILEFTFKETMNKIVCEYQV